MPAILVPSSSKRITTQGLLIPKLNGRENFFEKLCLWYHPSLQGTASSNLATATEE